MRQPILPHHAEIQHKANMISVLILTKDEERNLPACIDTVRWSDDIHVLDSYSTDLTVAIAEQRGAKVWYRAFDSFSQQQNWALENISFRYPWVLYIDADERVTPVLAEAMMNAVQNPEASVAFRVRRRDFFMGTWLQHAQATSYYLRLFRRDKMRYERIGHPVSVPDGIVTPIDGYLDHFPFSKGIAQWVNKHNFYSTQEAQQLLVDRADSWSLRKAFLAETFEERRRNLKQFYYRIPGRPLVKALGLYFVKGGFLDGYAGFAYSVLMGFYEYLIVLKGTELKANVANANTGAEPGAKPLSIATGMPSREKPGSDSLCEKNIV
jgi:glycosyltransferase involved in cell wall biosynthesis